MLTLNTRSPGPQHVQVLDPGGRSLLQVTVQGGQAELDLSGIPAGTYLLLVKDERGRIRTHRFGME